MKKYKDYFVKEKKEFWSNNPIKGDISINIQNLNIDKFLMYCDNDDTVVKELYWTDFKGWELTSLTIWANLLHKAQKGVVLDIGSYSGIYSLISSKVSTEFEIYGFDIQQKCIDRLQKNIEINNILNIKTHRAACANNNGELTFYFYKEKGILSSVASIVPNKMNDIEEKVGAIRLDDFLNKNESIEKVELIKIDVEGAENETLKGLSSTLQKDKPDVLIEVNKPEGLVEVKKKFPKDYKIYDINEDVLEIKKLKWFKKPSKHRNYLFTTKKRDELEQIFRGKVC